MINFCLTNQPELIKGQWMYKKQLTFGISATSYDKRDLLKHSVWLYYDWDVEVIESSEYLIAFCGILWEGKVTDFLKDTKQNGIFYAIVIDKKSGKIQIINDFSDSFFLNYHVSGRHFVVTNEIKAYSPRFKINNRWVNWSKQGLDLYQAPPPGKENITPLEGVQYLGAGQVLTLQNLDKQLTCSCHTYFSYNDDISKLFFEKPKYDYKSALDTVKRIIRKNCERIKEKYGTELIHFCSTGVDSLALQSFLDDVPIYGYYIDDFNRYGESVDLYKKLYSDYGGTLLRFYSSKILDIIDRHVSKLQKTINYKPAHLMFMHMRDRYKLHRRVIIQGNAGDHIFCHDRHYVIRHAVHRWGMTDADEIWDRCIPHYGFCGPVNPAGIYSRESRLDEINKYISNPCKDFATSMMQLRYSKRLPSLTGQYMPDQLMIDPYADLRLWKLLPSSDLATQEASMLDAQIQKDIISDKFLPYLNPYTAGLHWFYDQGLNNITFKKKTIDNLLKNIKI